MEDAAVPTPETVVFISYTQDSDEHVAKVRQLADTLRQYGLHTLLDQYELPRGPAEGWPRWMERGIQRADHVVCVCSKTFRRRLEGMEAPGTGAGADWEGNILYNLLYRAKTTGNNVVPVLFDVEPEGSVPVVLDGLHRHRLPGGFEGLYRHLTNQSPQATPAVGPGIVQLPSKPTPPLAPAWNLGLASTAQPVVTPAAHSPGKEQARSDLVELLLELFSAEELRQVIAFGPRGDKLSRALPTGPVSAMDLAVAAVATLDRSGQIDDDLFTRLRTRRPGRIRDIDPVARTWKLL